MKNGFKVLGSMLLSAVIVGATIYPVSAKTSQITKVIGSNVYYYSATTGTEVSSKKDFGGWRGPHRKGNNEPRVDLSYPDYYKKCDLAQ